MNREQALSASQFHMNEGCTRHIGPRGAVKEYRTIYRRNGRNRLWKRDRERFEIPVKYGFRGPYLYVHNLNVIHFHTYEECPLNDPNFVTRDERSDVRKVDDKLAGRR